MIGFAAIAAGSPSSSSALTDHLLNNTVSPERARLAAYYARGMVREEIYDLAQQVAGGTLSFSAAVDEAKSKYLQNGFDPDLADAAGQRLTNLLNDLAFRLSEGLGDAPVGIVRPDLHPLAARGLGIEDGRLLDRDAINALLVGRRADGEKIAGKHYAHPRRLPTDPKTGEERLSVPNGSYDFCPTPDKSVSVAWGFANPAEQARIYTAHIESARDAVAYIAERIGRARVGEGGRDGAEPGHVGWIEFTHHTARRTQFSIVDGAVKLTPDGSSGDPDLHTHFLIPNAVFCESGRVGSLDTAGIQGFIHEADAIYHMRLAQNLTDAGFATELDDKTGAVRLSAVPDDIRMLFSKRTAIGELLARKLTEDRGEDWGTLSQEQREARVKVATQDRDQKIKGGKDDIANFEDWKRQAQEACNWEPTSFLAREAQTVELSQEMKQQMAYDVALPILDKRFQHKAVLQHFEPRIAAARGMIAMGGGYLADVDAITARMRAYGVQQYGDKTALVWGVEEGNRYTSVTTALHETDEKEFIALAQKAADDRSGAIPASLLHQHMEHSKLDFADAHGRTQRAAIARLGAGGRFGVAIGAAGAGKTAMLKPLVSAWREQGREVHGASLAWRQADDLVNAGVDQQRVAAFSVLIGRLRNGTLTLNARSVVAVDEFGLLGTRQALELLRLREQMGFSIVALGDDKQCGSIEAGAIIELSRRVLGAEQVPQILTTIRQQTEREREIAGLFRQGRAAEALDMKRADGTAEMVPGGYDGVVARVARLYVERLKVTGEAPTIAAPTNTDAHRISEKIRQERRKLGQLGPDLVTVRATDGERNYGLPLAWGDRVRLFRSIGAKYETGRGGSIGRNGSVLEVVGVGEDRLTLRARTGKVGSVAWSDLKHSSGRIHLAYGDAMTIHTAQGVTSKENILALPAGSQAIDGKSGYSGNTRHRQLGYFLTNEAAEREGVRKRRALNDTREVTLNDRWANVARALANQPEKDTAIALFERAVAIRRGGVKAFPQLMPDVSRAAAAAAMPAHEVAQRRSLDLTINRAREVVHQALALMRRVPAHIIERIHHRQERILGQGRGLGR